MGDFVPRFLVDQLFPDQNSLSAPAKIICCDHPGKTVFGGITAEPLVIGKDWRMVIGTVIIVPVKILEWYDTKGCDWCMEDLLTEGMHPKYWRKT